MNEQLQTALSDLIIKGTQTVESAGGFIVSEIPEAAQQALLYYGVISFVWFAVMIAWFCVVARNLKIGLKYEDAKNHGFLCDTHGVNEDAIIVYSIFTIIGSVLFMNRGLNFEWLKVLLAPKIWLIEYAGDLVK